MWMWFNITIFIQQGQIQMIHLDGYYYFNCNSILYIYHTGSILSLIALIQCPMLNSFVLLGISSSLEY